MARRAVVKEYHETCTEQSQYGTFEVHYIKRFEHHEIDGRVYQTETTIRNGVRTFSADYPADTEYARKRLEA